MESITKAALGAFCITFFKVLGFAVACLPLLLLFGLLGDYEEEEPELYYNERIIPNAEGKRKKLSTHTPTILQIEFNGVIGVNHLTDSLIRDLLVESREGRS